MLFTNIKYTLSSTFPLHRRDELAKILDANGASQVDLAQATYVITDTVHFEGHETVLDNITVVTDEWVDRSIVHGKQQDPKLFSADPNMIFSGVIACAADLEACDKEVICAGINALGGLYREGYTRDCTHVLAPRPGSDKYTTAIHYQSATHAHVVLPHWFDDCFKLFVRLDEAPYAWPDPPLLRAGLGLEKARLPIGTKAIVKSDVLADEIGQGQAKALVTIQKNIWKGKRVLLSLSLALEQGRREAVEVSIQRAGGQAVPLIGDENAAIDDADVYITQHRTGFAFVKAMRANKTIGTLSWLFNVHKTGIVSCPNDQLLHFPTRPEPVENFPAHKITATNYEGDGRKYVKKLIELMGAEFTPQMTATNTVVVAAFISGDKTAKAREWNIPVVNHTWLEDCFVAWSHVTPAQEKYVIFPSGVNFGPLVGRRVVEPLSDAELLEIEKADEAARIEEARVKTEKEKDELERAEKAERERLEREHRQAAMDLDDVGDGEAMLKNEKSIPVKKANGRSVAVEEEEEEEEESGAEEQQPTKRGRGRAPKKSMPAKKANGKSKTVESEDESEHEAEIDSQRRDVPSAEPNGKSKAIDSIEANDESESEQPRRLGRLVKSTPIKRPIQEDTIVAISAKPKPTPSTKSRSKLSLLNDDLDTSEEEALSPLGPTRKMSAAQSRPKKGRLAQAHPTDDEENEEPNSKVSTKFGPPRNQKSRKAVAGLSGLVTPHNQKGQSRKQPFVSGPTPGKTVSVEIISPRKPTALSGTHSLTAVAADGASLHSSPKRGRPGDRLRSASSAKSREESPLSSPGSPTIANRFSEEAIRLSSIPTPIAGSSGLQRTPSRRRAATKATMRLHEIAPDMLNFQKEMRTGAIRNPWENQKGKGKAEPESEENKKRRASAVSDEMQDESEVDELDARDKKKRKIEVNEGSVRKSAMKRGHENGVQVPAERKGSKKKARLSHLVSDEESDSARNFGRGSNDGADASDICLMTTQVTLGEGILKGLRQLGVKITTKPSECNLLLANQIGRTEKFLCAMASTRHVVTEKWANESAQAKRILPPELFRLNDPEGEKKHNFKLAEALERAQSSDRKLLEGHTFYFTKKAHQSDKFGTHKNVVLSAGGKVVAQNPTVRILKNHKDRHVISTSEDEVVWGGLAEEGFHIYVAEFILMGVLTQKMEWGSKAHRLDNNL
ncbi:hypothetical protein DFH11DRAFT_1859545 [Phellopilus nigrolimitatus]|nr:hypothetical protein DFH11DRAFT_1859545 [Phellopilus nigrolimitatus]